MTLPPDVLRELRACRAAIAEPEPGKLAERDARGSLSRVPVISVLISALLRGHRLTVRQDSPLGIAL
jgi:hypothetical protein